MQNILWQEFVILHAGLPMCQVLDSLCCSSYFPGLFALFLYSQLPAGAGGKSAAIPQQHFVAM